MFDTPIIINNRNRLTTTRNLADHLTRLGYSNIVILDNDSTYSPLLRYYDKCPYRIVATGQNHGSLALWNCNILSEFKQESWIAYTDSDIALNHYTPEDFIYQLSLIAKKYNSDKVGLAIKIDDLPTNNEYYNHVREWESRYWRPEIEPDVYPGEIDTTFAILKLGQPFKYQAIRVGRNFTCRHLPWYLDWDKLDEEEQYYIDHSSPVSTYKRRYDQWKLGKMNSI